MATNSAQVATSKWLKSLGISSQLTQRYLNSGWIEQVGWGAFKKPKDKIEWLGLARCKTN